MRNFKELEIWKKGMKIVEIVYKLTEKLPDTEKFGLKSQMQRAAVSIPSNIAEGCSRNSNREFKRFLEISIGSSFELETQLLLSKKLCFLTDEDTVDIFELLNKYQKQTNSFISSLKRLPR